MKNARFLQCLITILLPSFAACGDVTLEEISRAGATSKTQITKIKGDLTRTDTIDPKKPSSIIFDLKKGEITTVDHQEKFCSTMNIRARLLQAEAARKETAKNPPKPAELITTGRKEMVGGWEAEVYEFINALGTKGTFWAVKDFPNWQSIRDQRNRLDHAISDGEPSVRDLVPGLIVKHEIKFDGEMLTTTLVRVEETLIADSAFELPKDYKKILLPVPPSP